MKTLREHIKTGNFKNIYLLYGSENYLLSFYRKKLVEALKGDGDEMNYSHFEGKFDSFEKLIDVVQTLPFFADRRVILIEDSELFNTSNDLADSLGDMPETTFLVFAEKTVDKRNKLYKFVKERGYICEFTTPTPEELKQFIANYLSSASKKIAVSTCDYFLDACGFDMSNLRNEMDKLIAFSGDRDVIQKSDIDSICTIQLTNRIFDMTDAIAVGDKDKALVLYSDLIKLKEKPMGIMYLIRMHFNRLLGICDLRNNHKSDSEIASVIKVPNWTLKKYYSQLRHYDYRKLRECVECATDIETDFKTGKYTEQLAAEIMIVKLSSM